MYNNKKQEIDNLFMQSKEEYFDPQTLEFYECVKLDKIVDLLLQDEKFTCEYLSTVTKEFFDLVFCEINDTAERIMQKFLSDEIANKIRHLCEIYKDDHNAECVESILNQLRIK